MCQFTIMSGLRFKSSFLSTVAVFWTWVNFLISWRSRLNQFYIWIYCWAMQLASWVNIISDFNCTTDHRKTPFLFFHFSTWAAQEDTENAQIQMLLSIYLSTINTINKVLACMPHFFWQGLFSYVFYLLFCPVHCTDNWLMAGNGYLEENTDIHFLMVSCVTTVHESNF